MVSKQKCPLPCWQHMLSWAPGRTTAREGGTSPSSLAPPGASRRPGGFLVLRGVQPGQERPPSELAPLGADPRMQLPRAEARWRDSGTPLLEIQPPAPLCLQKLHQLPLRHGLFQLPPAPLYHTHILPAHGTKTQEDRAPPGKANPGAEDSGCSGTQELEGCRCSRGSCVFHNQQCSCRRGGESAPPVGAGIGRHDPGEGPGCSSLPATLSPESRACPTSHVTVLSSQGPEVGTKLHAF